MRLFASLTAGLLLVAGINGSVAHAADASPSDSCTKLGENQPETLEQLHAQKQKRAVDTSTNQLFYQMAQSDGTGMAKVAVPSWLEKQQSQKAEAQQTGQSEQQAGQAEGC